MKVKLQGNELCIIIPHVTDFWASQLNELSLRNRFACGAIAGLKAPSSGSFCKAARGQGGSEQTKRGLLLHLVLETLRLEAQRQ